VASVQHIAAFFFSGGTTVEVSAGVKDGNQVILNLLVDLTSGRKVQVRSSPPPKST
jgi:hypothetical protein